MSLLRLEHAALIALAAVLPLFEAPKNLLWLAYCALWLWNRARSRDWGGPWDRWDTLIALWLASGYAAAAFAGIRAQEWGGTNDLLRYASVLWLLKRSRYPETVLNAVFWAIIAGTLAALCWGYYGLFFTRARTTLGLKSVGHVNHSAIYLAIVFGAALVAVRAGWRTASVALRIAGIGLLAIFALSLLIMESRGAAGAAFIATVVLLARHAVRVGRGLHAVAIGTAIAIGLVLAIKPQVLEKTEARIEENRVLAYRDGIWRSSFLAWREHPVFGIGMNNYSRFGFEQLERWSAKRGERFERNRYFLSSHAHSLYVNTLVERGVVGFGILLAVLLAWLVALVRNVPAATAPPSTWAWWGGAASAWLVSVIVGTVNTTLHHEHALLSMLLLGGWLQCLRSTRSTSSR